MQNKEYKSIYELQSQKVHFDLKIKSYLFRPKHVLDHFISETAFELQLHRFQQKTGESLLLKSYRYLKFPFSSDTDCDQIYVGIISYYLRESHESPWALLKMFLISFKTTLAKPKDTV